MGRDGQGDAFAVVQGGRRANGARVQCLGKGCSGSCPLRVVLQGATPYGAAAQCLGCRRKYVAPAGARAQARKEPPKQDVGGKAAAALREVEALRKQLAALKQAKGKPAATAPVGAGVDGAASEPAAEVHEQAKKVQAELRSLLSLDECLRP